MGLGNLFACFKGKHSDPNARAKTKRHRFRRRRRESSKGHPSPLSIRTRVDAGPYNGPESPTFSEEGYASAQEDALSRTSFDDFYSPRISTQVIEDEEEPGFLDRLAAWWDIRRFPELEPIETSDQNTEFTVEQQQQLHSSNSGGPTLTTGRPPSSRPHSFNSNSWGPKSPGSTGLDTTNTPGVLSHPLVLPSRGHSPELMSMPLPPGSFRQEDVMEPPSGCIPLFTAAQSLVAHRRFLRLIKPRAGKTFERIFESGDRRVACNVWEEAIPASFQVRSRGYMRTKIKEPAFGSIYTLLGVDMYSFDFKLSHVAQHVQLPELPELSAAAEALPPKERIPPLLIINLQLPTYPATLFGGNDGPGQSLVYYFGLPEGWDPSQVKNSNALGLLQRFIHNEKEFDGQMSRDRFKLIGRVVNVEEWIEKGPLSSPEAHLLKKYNDTPLLTRPQHRYYSDPAGRYFEIDLDVHNYAYLARRALSGYLNRLESVVFENAFLLQGNRAEELPEMLLGSVRLYRISFRKFRPFPAAKLKEGDHSVHEKVENGNGKGLVAAGVVDVTT